MTKIDIFSGFLGAGKTTLIKKLIAEAYQGEKLVLIENEFGEISVDGGFLAETGIQINEMSSGCICCSLVGDFAEALHEVVETYAPDRILIEPSGVGKLSDVIAAVSDVEGVALNAAVTVSDAARCSLFLKNFGEFYSNQIEYAGTIVLSRTGGMAPEKAEAAAALLRGMNENAVIVMTPWDELSGKDILSAMEGGLSLAMELNELEENTCPVCGHHHDEHEHHHHDECGCCHDDDDDDEHEHHHHHDHDEDEHHHDECGCCHDDDDDDEHEHHHHHHHHGHHHADEIFTSWGVETARVFTENALKAALEALNDEAAYGAVLRAKGMVRGEDGFWHFDYVPGEFEVRRGAAAVTGRLCVIGSNLNENALKELFLK